MKRLFAAVIDVGLFVALIAAIMWTALAVLETVQ
ncbi:hypothetical protein UFOVP407_11 [uncultured Caudovirales phage]|uniref:Uncharacterized protein n=1 Tax=uncultured Caudovirales phage TaxID=2100421 RepID=A0A6J5M397_9CAUD|nr:hypothetical protein UFOVP407_11 [uncultured Caudovirales phage]